MKSTAEILKEVKLKLTVKIVVEYLESNQQVKQTEGSTFKFIQDDLESKFLIQSTQPQGKLVFKYLRDEDLEITGIEMVDKDGVDNLPELEAEKLKALMADKPEWFTK